MLTRYILQGGVGGSPTADSRFAVPCPSDRNALRNPPRQQTPTVTGQAKRGLAKKNVDDNEYFVNLKNN